MNTPIRARALRWIIRAAHLNDEQMTDTLRRAGHTSVRTGIVKGQIPINRPTSLGAIACGTLRSRSISVSVTGSASAERRRGSASGASIHLHDFGSAQIGVLSASSTGQDKDRFYLEFDKHTPDVDERVTIYLGTEEMLTALNHALAAFDLEQQATEQATA